jgi:hypothetical protein
VSIRYPLKSLEFGLKSANQALFFAGALHSSLTRESLVMKLNASEFDPIELLESKRDRPS